MFRMYIANDCLSQHFRVKEGAIDLENSFTQAFHKKWVIFVSLD